MSDNTSPTSERQVDPVLAEELLIKSALDQVQEYSRLYNEAVGSYNTHLDNHRDRRNLQDIPFREPITSRDYFDEALDGYPAALRSLLDSLIDESHLDSQLRRHPRTYPIHVEAAEHLELIREQLITTLEEVLQHVNSIDE